MSRFENAAKKSLPEDIKSLDGQTADDYNEKPELKLVKKEDNVTDQKESETSTLGQKTVDELLEEGRRIDGPRHTPPEESNQKSVAELLKEGESIDGPRYTPQKSAEELLAQNREEKPKAEEVPEVRQEAAEKPTVPETGAENKERTLRDLGKEAVAIVTERAKGKWGKFKEKISGIGKWIQEKISDAKIGAEMIAEDVNKKYNELKERGAQALDNLSKATKAATDQFFDATYNMGLKAWDHMVYSHQEDKAQKEFLKAQTEELAAREKVRKQRGKLDRAFLFKGRKEKKLGTLQEDLQRKRETLEAKRKTLMEIRVKRKEVDERLGRERLAEQAI